VLVLDHYRALRDGAGLIERSERGKLVVSGADRATYLHALLTNDIAALKAGAGCYAAYLTPLGRMIADMWVYELGDLCLLDVHSSVKDTVLARLDQLVFSEDVRLGDVTDTFSSLGVYGPRSPDVLATAFRPAAPDARVPEDRLRSLQPYENLRLPFLDQPVIVVASNRYGTRGFDLYCERTRAEHLGRALEQAGSTRVGDEAVETVRIEAGRPEFTIDMDQDTIPLEAGIEKEAISFTKGCYPGQEVVIRILHRGHGRIAKRLTGLLVRGEEVPARGDRLIADDREVGRITSATFSPALASPIALGYVSRDLLEPGTALAIVHGDGRIEAVVGVLPFIAPGS
jgi:folate-binding protein YgfZ